MMHRPDNPATSNTGKTAVHIAVLIFAALVVMSVQIISPGYYYKIIEHAVMVQRYVPQFADSFSRGDYYPGWMAGDFKGYGSPIFVYYSPAFYALTAVTSLAVTGIPLSGSLVDLLFLVIGGIGVYTLLRETHGGRAGVFGALLYMLLPTRMLDMYYANTPAGRLALAWLPFVLHFARTCAGQKPRRWALAGLAFSYAALILTHIASAYIFTPFVLAYALLEGRGESISGRLARVPAGLIAGVGLSAFFFLPVLLMRGAVHIELMSRMEDYSAARNLLFWVAQGPRVPGIAELIRLLAVNAAAEVFGICLVYLIARRYAGLKPCRLTSFSLWAGAACIFLMSPLSLFLWDNVPGLKTWSFPNRLVTLLVLFMSLVGGIAAARISTLKDSGRAPAVLALAVVLAFAADSGMLMARAAFLTNKDLAGFSGRVAFMEYLPASVGPETLSRISAQDPLLSSKDDIEYNIMDWEDEERSFEVRSDAGALIRIKTFYFPGWKAWVDGREAPIGVEKGTGAMLIDTPPGKHSVELRFTDTWPRKAGKIISIVTLMLLVFPYGKLRRVLVRAV